MDEASKRLTYLVGEDGLEVLQKSTVMIVGIGGVGGYVAESLARSFVGRLILIDNDVVSESNLNRQIIATYDTLGQAKVEVMKQRISKINLHCEVIAMQQFYSGKDAQCFTIRPDFVVDAIDTLTSKMDLIEQCSEHGIPCISSLGMGNRLDPSCLRITTLDKTSYDPLAKALRNLVKKRGYRKKISVVFSSEIPLRQHWIDNPMGITRKEVYPPSSSAFVPAAAGLLCGSYVVGELLKKKKEKK